MDAPRRLLNRLLGELPGSAELYWLLRGDQPPRNRFQLTRLRRNLPALLEQMQSHRGRPALGRRLLIFSCLHFWLEYNAVLALTLAGLGYDVTLAYIPIGEWRTALTKFDQRKLQVYARRTLAPLAGWVRPLSLHDIRPADLPPQLAQAIERISLHDLQYTYEREDVDTAGDLYRLRLERNGLAARAMLGALQAERPDVVLIPNGVIMEFGAAYEAARAAGLPVVTYEFNEDPEQIWLSHDDPVILQNTDSLWDAWRDVPLTEAQRARLAALEEARMGARTFGKSERLWQDVPAGQVESLRASLGLDDRPLALLATNVFGDSLTLGRNAFLTGMSEWIVQTIAHFAERPAAQLVVRVHPGERYSKGPSMVDVIRAAYPALPPNVRVVGPMEPVNTYDLMSLAVLGLTYTTTTGLEMAMRGIPVVTVGKTHFRGRGFTVDPADWPAYLRAVDDLLAHPRRLSPEQVQLAWNYAYRFFFQYPRPFPWRLVGFWDDLEEWPLARVLAPEGRARFEQTFRFLAGEPIEWSDYAEETA